MAPAFSKNDAKTIEDHTDHLARVDTSISEIKDSVRKLDCKFDEANDGIKAIIGKLPTLEAVAAAEVIRQEKAKADEVAAVEAKKATEDAAADRKKDLGAKMRNLIFAVAGAACFAAITVFQTITINRISAKQDINSKAVQSGVAVGVQTAHQVGVPDAAINSAVDGSTPVAVQGKP